MRQPRLSIRDTWRFVLTVCLLCMLPRAGAFGLEDIDATAEDTVPDVEQIMNNVRDTYSRIHTYRADAYITVVTGCTPCGTKQLATDSGTYFFRQQPESASVTIGQNTYTSADMVGEYKDRAEGRFIVRDPVLSLSLVDWIAAQDSAATAAQGDTLAITFSREVFQGSVSYYIEVDRHTWTICYIRQRSAADTFAASYHYQKTSDGIPVLTDMAVDGDTTLQSGGYDFSNIVLNGDTLAVTRPGQPHLHRGIAAGIAGRRLIVTWPHDVEVRSLEISDMMGRRVTTDRPGRGCQRSTLILSGRQAAGIYMLRVHTAAQTHTRPFILSR